MTKHTKKLTKNSFKTIKEFKSIIYKDTENLTKKQNLDNIFSFFKQKVNQSKFNTLYKNTKFFSSDKLGKSGGIVGVVKIKGKEYVIKMYKLNIKKKKYTLKYDDKCAKIYFPYNELIINTILSNMKRFISPSNYKIYKTKYSKYFIPLKTIGLSEEYSYMINEKIGFSHQKYYYTNLYDLFIENYIPSLIKCIENKDTKTINLFLNKFTRILKEYFECIKFLNENLEYINSDLKCKNVFIKKNNSKSLDTFITNFTPLISDLDKATIKINKLLILPKEDKYLHKYLAKKSNKLSKVYEIRYGCTRNTKLCNRFEPYQYDIITLLFDIYILLYKHIYIKTKLPINDYYNYFKILNDFVKKTLNINNDEFTIFYKRIHKSFLLKIKSDTKLSFHINAMLYNFCKSL